MQVDESETSNHPLQDISATEGEQDGRSDEDSATGEREDEAEEATEVSETKDEEEPESTPKSVETKKSRDSGDGGWHVVSRRGAKKIDEKNRTKKITPSLLDQLADEVEKLGICNVNKEKAEAARTYLYKSWKNWAFAKVIRVQGMGPSHIVYRNKADKNSETYLKNMEEFEEMCARDKESTGEDNVRKSTSINWEWGFYGWVRTFSGEIAYIHHSNYAQPDFGISYSGKHTDGIRTQFMMSVRDCTKTPRVGDYICGIVSRSTRYEDKFEMSPWFVCSYTLYRTINIIKFGKEAKMFATEKLESRLIASMITNGNEVLGIDKQRTMTPVNCEDGALYDHYVYCCITMVCILGVRLSDASMWKVNKVGNLNYFDFIVNLGNIDAIEYLNANPPMSGFINF
jgi:hypothetical protein